jgi:hypothetical protein
MHHPVTILARVERSLLPVIGARVECTIQVTDRVEHTLKVTDRVECTVQERDRVECVQITDRIEFAV